MAQGTSESFAKTGLVSIDWTYADFAAAPHGTKRPQFDTDTSKVLDYGTYSVSNFPGTSASQVEFLAYIDDVHPSIDGEYYKCVWDGVNVAAWVVPNHWRELQIRTGMAIKIEPNFIDVGWGGDIGNGVSFEDVPLPAKFDWNGGFVLIDWLADGGGSTRRVHNQPWQDFNEWTYKKYDMLASPISNKYLGMVTYDFNFWACIKPHTHVQGDASTQPFNGSIYWQRVRVSM